jgi:hypothetical protein
VLLVTTRMGMLVPFGNGLYLLPRIHTSAGLPPAVLDSTSGSSAPVLVECDPSLWHRRLGHLNMLSLHAQHLLNDAPTLLAMPSYLINLSCDSCNLNNDTSAPRNRTASAKHAAPLQQLASYLLGHVHVPLPYGLR